MDSIDESQYGEEAFTSKRYEHMTQKQKAACDVLVKHRGEPGWTQAELAEEAGVSPGTIQNVLKRYPHVVDHRRSMMRSEPAADGGTDTYDITLTSSEVFKAINMLPEELSKTFFNQVRKQSMSDGGEELDRIFDDDGNLDNE